MNELKKTLGFVGIATVVVLVAWWTRYTPSVQTASDMRGQPLLPSFTDALAASSLEIFEYDPNAVKIKAFKVAQVNNQWSIPSHENYPADAKDHLARAATSLIGLKILDVAAESPTQEQLILYGVVEPAEEVIQTVTRGIGKRVVFRDRDDRVLADLIIGNKVPDREELRYVRIKGQDPVYVVKLADDRFSSEFGDWIEKDLLKLNPWDIKDVQLHDYSFDALTGAISPRSQVVLAYDDLGTPRWKLVQNLVFDQNSGGWKPQSLADDEELDTAKLDAMRTALDDLKIVDVRRKPAGISATLSTTGKLKSDRETLASLAEAGFYLASAKEFYSIFPMIGKREIKPDDMEVVSSEGEVRVGMKDGVRYVLRFGQVVAGQSAGPTSGDGAGVNRYLFVMAEFDPDLIPKPDLQPLPEVPHTQPPAEGSSTSTKPSTAEQTEKGIEEHSAVVKEPSPAGEQPASQPPATGGQPAQAEQPANASQASQTNGGTQKPEDTQKPADIQAERERIEKENQRKQEEYQENLKKGQERVKELNARFADWYYIISDEVYRKIHLGLKDIVKKQEKPAEPADKEMEEGESKPGESAEMPEQAKLGEPAPAATPAQGEQKPAEAASKPAETKQAEEPAEPQPPAPAAAEPSSPGGPSTEVAAPPPPSQSEKEKDQEKQSANPPETDEEETPQPPPASENAPMP